MKAKGNVGFQVCIHLQHSLVKPIADELELTSFQTLSNKDVIEMTIPCLDEFKQDDVKEKLLKIWAAFPRMVRGICLEKYSLDDGETIDREWVE